MPTLPLFYYPTTVLWVDDDKLFVNTIANLANTRHHHVTLHCPNTCVNEFEQYQSPLNDQSFLRSCIEHDQHDMSIHAIVDLDVTTFHRLHNNPARKDEISLMVVDYHMPKMNGLALCETLNRPNIKKILLTGEAGNEEAVTAFNNNLINRFIRKDNSNLLEEVRSYINELTLQYFRDLTQPLLSHLEATQAMPQTDPVFVAFFNEWCEKNRIVEYFIIDKNGSMLGIDGVGNRKILVMHTDRSLDAFTSLNDDTVGAEDVVAAVRRREKLPFFGIGKECWEVEIETWMEFMRDAKVLDGRERYYWVETTLT